MTDTRQVLEEAWDTIARANGLAWATAHAGKFARFLDAEAWTDAALMLIDKSRWRILSLHETEVEGAPPFEIRLGQRDANFGRAKVRYGTGETEALALTQAALRAKEAGDV